MQMYICKCMISTHKSKQNRIKLLEKQNAFTLHFFEIVSYLQRKLLTLHVMSTKAYVCTLSVLLAKRERKLFPGAGLKSTLR